MHSSRGRTNPLQQGYLYSYKYKHYKRNAGPGANIQQQNQHRTTKISGVCLCARRSCEVTGPCLLTTPLGSEASHTPSLASLLAATCILLECERLQHMGDDASATHWIQGVQAQVKSEIHRPVMVKPLVVVDRLCHDHVLVHENDGEHFTWRVCPIACRLMESPTRVKADFSCSQGHV